MRHARSLDFDDLEARKLLSKAHLHPAHAAAAVSTPLVLDGTLTVDHSAATVTQNVDGSSTTVTPVTGTINGLGKVHGFWDESTDEYGDYLGPDTMQLRDPQGAFVVVFSIANIGKAHKSAHGAVFNVLPQKVHGGSGAYATAVESGTIQLGINSAQAVVSMTLNTTSK